MSEEEKKMTPLYCERNLEKVTMADLYGIIFKYSRVGRMGIVRFPKRIRDLYRKLTFKFAESKLEITSDMVTILNNKHLEYCNIKFNKKLKEERTGR